MPTQVENRTLLRKNCQRTPIKTAELINILSAKLFYRALRLSPRRISGIFPKMALSNEELASPLTSLTSDPKTRPYNGRQNKNTRLLFLRFTPRLPALLAQSRDWKTSRAQQ